MTAAAERGSPVRLRVPGGGDALPLTDALMRLQQRDVKCMKKQNKYSVIFLAQIGNLSENRVA